MPAPVLVLANAFLEAGFAADTSNLLSLRARKGGPSLITRAFCRYAIGKETFSDDAEDFQAVRPETISIESGAGRLRSVIRMKHVTVTRTFRLRPKHPLLEMTFTVHGADADAKLQRIALPAILFAPDILDVTEDDRILDFDGAELGDGIELPCWRVLFCKGHRDGLLLAARSKEQMSHVQTYRTGIEVRPHVMCSYSSDNAFVDSPLRADCAYTARFELGPWRKGAHAALLRQAALDKPLRVRPPFRRSRASGPKLPGLLFPAAGLVPAAQVARGFHPAKWLLTRAEEPGNPTVLLANAHCTPPPIVLKPGLRGLYRVLLGTPNAAVTLRLPGEPAGIQRYSVKSPFHTLLTAPAAAPREGIAAMAAPPAPELDFGPVDLDGRALHFETTRNLYWAARIDYIRFVKLTPAEEADWRRKRATPPCLDLCGLADTYDIGYIWSGFRDPSPAPYRDSIWNHQRAGYRRIYWRIHGELADFPTRQGTMRPVMGRAHNVFEPAAKAYGLALRSFDLLKTALDAAREFDIELYGWFRLASFQSDTKPPFFRSHPEYGEVMESGYRWGNKMCFALPEVRRYYVDILTEAAAYGLQGLCLGALRHPPLVHYHPVLVDGYRRKYGRLPPRDMLGRLPAGGDLGHIHTLPEMTPEWVRWYRYRAGFVTALGRELRAALNRTGLRRVRIALWLRPNHCLFDGIDLPLWLREGLCDEVIADRYVATEDPDLITEPRPAWVRAVRRKARLIRGVGYDLDYARRNFPRLAAARCDGISAYESNDAVLNPAWLDLYDSLRRARPLSQG
jgi:hypothetical protein